ncbi:MAG: hypothetical protein Q9180_004234, partial [Flavoplaca navasiana]
MSMQHHVDIETMLRAFFGRAVHEWVFEESHRSLDLAEDTTLRHSAREISRNGFPAMLQLQSDKGETILLQALSE